MQAFKLAKLDTQPGLKRPALQTFFMSQLANFSLSMDLNYVILKNACCCWKTTLLQLFDQHTGFVTDWWIISTFINATLQHLYI